MTYRDLRHLSASADIPTRRAFLGSIATRMLGVSAGLGCTGLLRTLAAAPSPLAMARPAHTPRGRAKSVIYPFLRGGMSHLDTFDPKPGKTTQGPTEAIATRADGIRLGRYFPKLANQMDKAVLVRSMTSKQGAHPQAQ